MIYSRNIAGVAVNLDTARLPSESNEFALEYGLTQYIQDGAAVNVWVMAGKDEEKDEKGRLLVDGRPVKRPDDEVLAEKQEGVRERVANLQEADFTRRGGGTRQTPEEKAREAVIVEMLSAILKKNNKSLPNKTGKSANPEARQALIDKFYTAKKAAVDKEVARRAKSIDLGDMSDFVV